MRPSDVGLPEGPRRRLAGLWREEVATLAGVGVTWYTMLENGIAAGVSTATLKAIATALRLTVAETAYLHRLAEEREVERPREHAWRTLSRVCARTRRMARATLASRLEDLEYRRMLDDYRADPFFAAAWDTCDIATPLGSNATIVESLLVGAFAYEALTLELPDDDGHWLVVRIPDAPSAARLRAALS